MKRKNIFPLLAGIFLIYLLCRFTYQGGNQEGFIEGFIPTSDTITLELKSGIYIILTCPRLISHAQTQSLPA